VEHWQVKRGGTRRGIVQVIAVPEYLQPHPSEVPTTA
jgi:hypothetical protein